MNTLIIWVFQMGLLLMCLLEYIFLKSMNFKIHIVAFSFGKNMYSMPWMGVIALCMCVHSCLCAGFGESHKTNTNLPLIRRKLDISHTLSLAMWYITQYRIILQKQRKWNKSNKLNILAQLSSTKPLAPLPNPIVWCLPNFLPFLIKVWAMLFGIENI